MVKTIKKLIGQIPGIKRAYQALQWKKFVWSDWFNTVFKREIQIRTPFGFDLAARNYIANRMMLQGVFEFDEVELIKRQLEKCDVFIDVGANIGFYTCIARSMGRQVVAFEPQPHNLEFLYRNLVTNSWNDVEVFPVGLGDHNDLMTLYGASGPSASLVKGWAGYSTRTRQIIPVNTMDTLIGHRFTGKKLLIKIDVEGAEYGVLLGAKNIISQNRPVCFLEICLGEFHPGMLNPRFLETFDYFWQLGYEVRTADKEYRPVSREDVVRWVNAGKTDSGNFNYLFIPKDK